MTIALPGSSRRGLSRFFGRKAKEQNVAPVAEKRLSPEEVAKLFNKDSKAAAPAKTGTLNAHEKQERAQLSNLRGALYSSGR